MSNAAPLDDTNLSSRRAAWTERHLDPASRQLLADDSRYFLHQALSTPCLNVAQRAEGAEIVDGAGRRYLDFHGNNVHHIGYAHPRLVEALKRQLDELTYSPRRYTNAAAVSLARGLAELTGGQLSKVLFCPSGNDALEIALRIARGVTGRYKTVGFWGAFHGAGVAASSVGGEAMFRDRSTGPLLPGTSHVPPPTCYRCPYGWTEQPGCCLRTPRAIRAVLEHERDVAAVVVAPVNGVEYVPPAEFWLDVRRACDEHGALLVMDEVAVGLGKTGRMFAFEHYGVVPDILMVGKALGGGILPLAAVLTRERFDVLGDVAIGHYTHEKNPLLATAGLTTLAILRDDDLVERAAELGREALRLANGLKAAHRLVGDVRGLGLQLGIELVYHRQTKEPARAEAEEVLYLALERGLSLKISNGCILALSPPLIVSQDQLGRAFAVLDECLSLVD